MKPYLRNLRRDDSGATAIEYGLLAGLIAIAALSAFQAFGDGLGNMWGHVRDESTNAMG
ncbi:Flp family type IVb pilin [Pacificimonas flava]|uniref:Flp family type IVb pilin n=2 Tax=Pacificimonas TaxID=1960290 RepID=A0A219B486_9SPHN|nr:MULTISPECIES: Flp family type IVb pilin [Pacificimonas]MBZ6377092.1 Flp family type IVb pilin [Pacificimonas aurantium]OWV33177.1 Flp family type IVb pilin [Pacificimonas flava]